MLWMAATGVLFTVLNAAMKKLAHELDPWLVGFLRYLLGATVILAPALRRGVRELWPKAPKLQLVRGLFHTGGMMLWFAALPLVTLAELTAIAFSVPRAGPRSWSDSPACCWWSIPLPAAAWRASRPGYC